MELNDDATYASDKIYSITSPTVRANTDSVSILLVSDGSSITEYQYTTLNQVINHIKWKFADTGVEIYRYGDLGSFDKSKIGMGTLTSPTMLLTPIPGV